MSPSQELEAEGPRRLRLLVISKTKCVQDERTRVCSVFRLHQRWTTQEIDRDRAMRSYQRIEDCGKKTQIDQMIRTRNFRARNDGIETRVLVKSPQASVEVSSTEKRKIWDQIAPSHSPRALSPT